MKKFFSEKDFKNVLKYNEVTYMTEAYRFMSKMHMASISATGKGIGQAIAYLEVGA